MLMVLCFQCKAPKMNMSPEKGPFFLKEMKHLPTIKWFKDLVSTLLRSLYRCLGGRLTF